MSKKMNATEMAVKEAKEKMLYKLLLIIKESKDLEEAETKVKNLLNQ